ncbi:MAG: CDP-diacylglycerol--glycerol-3-phosphate 3-phosphatidyltransferase [Lachnospiraceae bacterium]|nr:CDP-diacylglycerol--glycerol-3-phosphate 3-phosphatidyltransferase [Lachnospiraceae bacterium]
MNVPNRLTILRVIMIPLFVLAMLWQSFPYSDYIAGGLFIAACITDFFDGYLARKYNQVTTFGKFMDPLADKLLVCAALICFLADDNAEMPVWVVIIIISREFIISGFRLVAAEKGVTISASYWGKVKTVVQMAMSILLIFNFTHPVFRIIDVVFIYAALVLTVISLVDYIYKNRGVMKDMK